MKRILYFLLITLITIALVGCSDVLAKNPIEDNDMQIPQYSRDDIPDSQQKIDIPWEFSTPEEQGMDSQGLIDMLMFIQEHSMPIHNVLIIRNDHIVCDTYFSPFSNTTKHDLFSATKSFTSTLIGIAIEEGYIEGVDQKVSDILTDVNMPKNDLGTEDMTIYDLLTMTAGHANDSVDLAHGCSNFPQTFFDQPFSDKPGEKFLYDSGASHLLAHILSKATGESVIDYAKRHLFEPLDITDYSWDIPGENVNAGGWGLRITPYNMAKFGYMALNKGNYFGKQIVSSEWLEEATCTHIKNNTTGYGYQWWTNTFGGYRADGFAGQYIFVLPELNIITVMTGGFNGAEMHNTFEVMEQYIIRSVKSDEAIPENKEAYNFLSEYIKELGSPTPYGTGTLPEKAKEISNITYAMDSLFNDITFDFSEEGKCSLTISQCGNTQTLDVGLDGIYRITKATKVGTLPWYPDYESVALHGYWEDLDTFIMQWQYVGEPYRTKYMITFRDGKVTVEAIQYVTGCAGPMDEYSVYKGKPKE